MQWDPQRYLQYGDQRTRPAMDLLMRVPGPPPRHAVDLGCGPGNSTRLLVERWPTAKITGVDLSPEMLSAARHAADLAQVTWVESAVEDWKPREAPDLIFSNAMLQYVDRHHEFFPRLLSLVVPGGVLAIQIPYRMPGQPWLNELHAVARSGPWKERFETLTFGQPGPTPGEYYSFLAPGAASIDVWTTEYLHVLEGENPVFQWTRGTAQLPFLKRLNDDEKPRFEAELARRLRTAYPRRSDGKTLFSFVRLFIVATANGV